MKIFCIFSKLSLITSKAPAADRVVYSAVTNKFQMPVTQNKERFIAHQATHLLAAVTGPSFPHMET